MDKKLLKRIEGLRKKLNKLGYTRNLNLVDSEVVMVSQELDCLLNQYYKNCNYQQLRFW